VSTVAPTGTISIIAGASSGIEPVYSAVFFRNVLSGARLVEIHPAVGRVLRKHGLRPDEVSDSSLAPLLEKAFGKAWAPARSLSVDAHVLMQAAFQRHCDSAVSKTVNLPHGAAPSEVARAYWLAYRTGCKGITIYRDRSRGAQVLEADADESCLACE
jgi:ribonucleoside-diphosphate reductase alpha chain